jgi:hypothetical protein
MSERFAPQVERLIEAWHGAGLDPDAIAEVEQGLARYEAVNGQLNGYRTAAAATLTTLAAKIVYGHLSFTDAVREWTTATAGIRPGTTTQRPDDILAKECKRIARKQTEAALARIDWPSIVSTREQHDTLTVAARLAGLVS